MPHPPRNTKARRIRRRLPASEALAALARSLGTGETGLGLAWTFAAGARLQQHVQPIRLESGRLLLRAADPRWAEEIRRNEVALLERLAEVLGAGRVCALRVENAAQGA